MSLLILVCKHVGRIRLSDTGSDSAGHREKLLKHGLETVRVQVQRAQCRPHLVRGGSGTSGVKWHDLPALFGVVERVLRNLVPALVLILSSDCLLSRRQTC